METWNLKASDRSGVGAWTVAAALLSAIVMLAACGGGGRSAANAPASNIEIANAAGTCPALAGTTIPASAIGLPTQGGTISSATLQAADTAAGLPEYCKVLGSIAAVNASDPPIKFEVNLPTTWNVKALQFGGGGFNGVVVTGLDNVPHAPADTQKPLAAGYVTFGSDSGHTGVGFDGSFGLNAQALANYGGESVKRTHDAAAYILNAYYKTNARRTYYAGGSKGGHEGLVAAQRYASDYDGVVAYYPANQNQAMVLSWYRMWTAAYGAPGAALNPAKQALLKSKVLSVCDALDGASDGIVANVETCRRTFAVNDLRCPGGADTGDTCLSDPQINTLMTAATPMEFAFPLAFGVTSIGPYPIFQGGDVGFVLFDAAGTDGTHTAYYGFDDAVIRYFDQQDPSSTSVNFDYRAWQPRLQQISAIYDSTNPDLDAFQKKGAKLLLIQGTTDMLVTPETTSAYYSRVAVRYGSSVKDFVRYYVQPGFGHGSGTYSMTWDSLGALDTWVEAGQAPASPVSADANTATKGRTRPLCEYPLFPKYKGTGDVNSATNFTCSAN